MGERPDELRRDPLGESHREADPLADPAGGPEGVTPVGPDPALGGGVGGGAVIDEEEANRVEIERTRAEIERTRADMSETVDAIQERLSPENLKEQAKDRVKEATVGRAQEAGSGIVETIRTNPLSAALTGIGLGWLLVSARGSASRQTRYRGGGYPYDYEWRTTASGGTSVPSPGEALGRARDRLGESATQAQDRASEVAR